MSIIYIVILCVATFLVGLRIGIAIEQGSKDNEFDNIKGC